MITSNIAKLARAACRVPWTRLESEHNFSWNLAWCVHLLKTSQYSRYLPIQQDDFAWKHVGWQAHILPRPSLKLYQFHDSWSLVINGAYHESERYELWYANARIWWACYTRRNWILTYQLHRLSTTLRLLTPVQYACAYTHADEPRIDDQDSTRSVHHVLNVRRRRSFRLS